MGTQASLDDDPLSTLVELLAAVDALIRALLDRRPLNVVGAAGWTAREILVRGGSVAHGVTSFLYSARLK